MGIEAFTGKRRTMREPSPTSVATRERMEREIEAEKVKDMPTNRRAFSKHGRLYTKVELHGKKKGRR